MSPTLEVLVDLQHEFNQYVLTGPKSIFEVRSWFMERGLDLVPKQAEAKPASPKFFVGQRVLLRGEVCTIVPAENKALPNTDTEMWVFVPSRKYASRYAVHNIKPLPNGQL